MKVGFVHLGCSKNLVDTEMTIGLLKNNHFDIVNDVNQAQMIIINTCGFIESAKQEAIDTILEMAEYKKTGICRYIIVMGCLVQRYKRELKKSLPEVDLFISIDEYDDIFQRIQALLKNEEIYNCKLDYLDRVITTGDKTTYLKIAEGCSNRCTYCAIPYIRGPYVSRPIEDILKEAEMLAQNGFEEIIVIAQDTSKYGIDIYGEAKLPELLDKLCKIEGFRWIRFLYTYPESITDELITVVKNNPKICKYFDMPIQHISNNILKKMNRKTTGNQIENIINNIREQIPGAILRTSLIVGFPGETNENFDELYKFIKKAKLDKLGAFIYSKEDGTPAEKLPNQVHYKTKIKRHNLIMKLAKEISEENLHKKIGEEYEVLIENKTFDGKYYVGRTYMDIPETDGVVFLKNTKNNLEGKFIKCKITDVNGYDLIGKIL